MLSLVIICSEMAEAMCYLANWAAEIVFEIWIEGDAMTTFAAEE